MHLLGHETLEEERKELEALRQAFEACNMANPCEDYDDEAESDSDDEMITAETLRAREAAADYSAAASLTSKAQSTTH